MPISERFQGANVLNAGTLSPYWGEHTARYSCVSSLISGKRVLDIACGTGYGIAFLKRAAKFVVGVDVDFEAAREAKCECDERAGVVLGNGLSLPFSDSSFDIVISFETLEHLHDRSGFLRELRRVLMPGGTLVLSTPNANYTRPVDGIPSNPFHIFEYSPSELQEELDQLFTIEFFFGQVLRPDFGIPPFFDAQQRLESDFITTSRLFAWRICNRLPIRAREAISHILWQRPFYPGSEDYLFDAALVDTAPVLLVICRRNG